MTTIVLPFFGLVGLLMLAPVLIVLSWALLLILGLGALLVVAAVVYFSATGQAAGMLELTVSALVCLTLLLALRALLHRVWIRISHPRAMLLPLDRLVQGDAQYFGSKAARLGVLSRSNVKIPQGFAISGRLHERSSQRSDAGMQFQIPPRTMRRIVRFYRRQVGRGEAMVRSSFAVEDQQSGTASGVFRSVRITRVRELEHAIESVWRSAYSDRARNLAFTGLPENLGLFVHQLVGGAWIGRMLTADPVSGALDSVTIEACAGDVYEPARARRIQVGPRGLPAGAIVGLSSDLIRRLVALGLEQSARYNGPVEVEWCSSEDSQELFALQVRPAPRKLRGRLWINSGAVELISEPLSPLSRELIQGRLSVEQQLELPLKLAGLGSIAGSPSMRWIEGRPYVDAELIGQLHRDSRRFSSKLRNLIASLRIGRRGANWDARLTDLRQQIDRTSQSLADAGLNAGAFNRCSALADLVYRRAMALHVEGTFLADQYASGLRLLADRWHVELDDLLQSAIAGVEENALNAWRRARQELEHANEVQRAGQIECYRHDWGHRAAGEIELSNPRPQSDPQMELPLVAASEESLDLEQARQELEKRCEGIALGHLVPWERWQLRRSFNAAVRASSWRENAKDTLLRGVTALRSLLLAHGRKLVEQGLLADVQDVFLLGLDELRQSFNRDLPAVEALDERREQMEAWRTQSAWPTIIETEDGELRRPQGTQGIAVSPGIARGRLALAGKAEAGDILVLSSPDVVNAGQLKVAAIVCETGSALCHLGQLCREMGLPMIVGLPGATKLEPGTRVEVDGWAGSLRQLGADGA
ncbi:MAG: PEP/pyruvate-binding domain-containing protein [Candidatus Alcyoniella australis]|nr:PEP/pyruvate-binding domain-containing protein [Candidatus Alcyoniella australis]